MNSDVQAPPIRPDSVLLVTAVRIFQRGDQTFIDDQTGAGLSRWADNFSHVTYCGVRVGDRSPQPVAELDNSITWVSTQALREAERISVIALPMAYRSGQFATTYRSTRSQLSALIAQSEYLCFTLGALVGDWGAIAALEASVQHRPYAAWFDRVEHEVMRAGLPHATFLQRIRVMMNLPIMTRYHRKLIGSSAVGMFQGRHTFEAYAPFADQSRLVYDTHTQPSDHISKAGVAQKEMSAASGRPLRIVYAGRAADMKGPLEWLGTLAKLRDLNVQFSAFWLGDGPELELMRGEIRRLRLADRVEAPGYVAPHGEVLKQVRSADVFVFCHKTPESPRCLIESLVSGTPIIGFASPYPIGLTAAHGGGVFTTPGDCDELAQTLRRLDRDRDRLAALIRSAARAGRSFDEETVYAERATILREHLDRGSQSG